MFIFINFVLNAHMGSLYQSQISFYAHSKINIQNSNGPQKPCSLPELHNESQIEKYCVLVAGSLLG